MRSKQLFEAIGEIYDCFIDEDAEDIAAIRDYNTMRNKRVYKKMKVAVPAACLCVIAIGAFAIMSRRSALRLK